ncbi:transcription elongation factor GreB [Acinetobacter baumannii]|jgi:transcription elongation factor GreB|uniref:Transcription elongation factor GreB n=5 Tax=Acinetobacter TaxID=469 RepID=A0A143J429_ACIPI|nr:MULTISPECIES: transcription elongation factor GreB [Acinetobacter]AMO39932.1 transcription elongation factor GreB [Acinetobacter sp. DUT-2]KCY33911.1 transcription elongation factor GreB [Acinetobacter baumannii 1288284]MDB0115561.1 transcription elongation factor GreB [Acinetobacter baumannii]MDR0069245.1 transcription elongation factor GreB [Acinetobacter sp. 11520]OBA09943.1 transcription elongation factor GreB [Acinetobacter calcoaceticus]TDM63808.1 transcription elongation factor GreB
MKSNLITRSGHDKLVAELKQLWHEERPEITKKVNWAASLGDRSENADYQYNKQLLRKIDRRVRYLGKRLEELKIVDYSPEQDGKVYFGAWVEIENEEGEQKTLRIVGIDEIYDHHPQHISIESPMARALLGKEVDDEIEVHTPSGKKLWYINTIRYEKTENSEI